MDREIRSLGAVGAGGESSHTLSYWVILKRKFGVPRNSFVHPKNQWEFSTWIILWCRLQENPCWIICFPKATFKVQISSPEQIPTARTNRTAKTLTFASMWLFPPSSILGHFLRGEPQRRQALSAVPWPPVRSLEGGSLHPDVNLVGF